MRYFLTVRPLLIALSLWSGVATAYSPLDCVALLEATTKLVDLRDKGYPRDELARLVKVADREYGIAYVTVYEFHKELTRAELGQFTLGLCEGYNLGLEVREPGMVK